MALERFPQLVDQAAKRAAFCPAQAQGNRRKSQADLDPWVERARASLVASFATEIIKDKAAVSAAIALRWSNGQTEGQITKLKVVKRQMYGRGKLDLVQARTPRRQLTLGCTKIASEPNLQAE